MNSIGQSKPKDVMTFRDYIAIASLPALAASEDGFLDPKLVSRKAYELADAMLKERGEQVVEEIVSRNDKDGLLDWAETIICNAVPMAHCTQKWDTMVKQWRDEKHGITAPLPVKISHGVNCPKIPHNGIPMTIYCHDEDYDGEYVINDIRFCGRCHQEL